MLPSTHGFTSPASKRRSFRDGLSSGRLLRLPGAFSPLVARAVESFGFDGVYVSGAAVAADLALPDIGLTTLSELVVRGSSIARATSLPTLVDADTGFGEPTNMARTISELEQAGVAGCHVEDQVNPKRCGHLDQKHLVAVDEVVRKIRAAVLARQDPNFIVCARTDAIATEGLEPAIERARAYVSAGADMIFPDAVRSQSDITAFREAIDAPILINMTEFGRSPLLAVRELESLGVNAVIWPVTTLRVAMKAITHALERLASEGHQHSLIPTMQTREELYEMIRYESYAIFDESVISFRTAGEHG